MKKTQIYSLTLVLTIILVGLFVWQTRSARAVTPSLTFATLYNGEATIDNGLLQFDAFLDPPVSRVGDLVALHLTLANQDDTAVAPEIQLSFPESLQVAVNRFESGTTYNFQTGVINWQPVLNASGGTAETTLYFTVSDVNPGLPDQLINATLRSGEESFTTDIKLWAGVEPSASFSIAPVRASVGQPIQLLAEMDGSGPFSQTWLLGDGRLIPASNPVVVYPAVGTYDIQLQVANPLATHHSQATVVIVPEPAAFFKMSDTTPFVSQEIEFTSQSGGLEPLEYLWDFGDGTFSTEKSPSHRYPAEGSYDVTLTVRNEHGQAQNYLQIGVGEPPIADAIITESGVTGQAISGQAFIDESAQSVLWDMGDGHTYEGVDVAHTYQARGDYIVTVNVVNAFGNTTMTKLVRIGGGSYYIYLPAIFTQLSDSLALTAPADELELLAQTIQLIENDTEIVLPENLAIDSLSPNEQLLWYINEARRQGGLNPVNLIASLDTAAKIHTDDMASNMFTSHTGSDGSAPYERLARAGYREGGYAGETTAWGFRYGREAVDFWLNSPPHRAILLNPIADQVGVAETTNYNAPSVWYWTAEFASSYGSITSQMHEAGVRLIKPQAYTVYEYGETALFGWSWPLPLETNQRFVVYLHRNERDIEIGQVRQPADNTIWYEYGLPVGVVDMTDITGEYGWFVRLETTSGDVLTRSEIRPLEVRGQYPASPTPTPVTVATTAPVLPSATPIPGDTPAPTATLEQSIPTVTAVPTDSGLGTESTVPTATATATPTTPPTSTVEPTSTVAPSATPVPTGTSTPSSVLPVEGTNP